VDVYKRVKQLRDSLAHSGRVTATSADEVELSSTLAFGGGEGEAPKRVTRAEIAQAISNCAWAEAQIMYILDSSDLILGLHLGSRSVAVVKPSRLPKDWKGVVLVPVANDE
jgi:hypothetical protein